MGCQLHVSELLHVPDCHPMPARPLLLAFASLLVMPFTCCHFRTAVVPLSLLSVLSHALTFAPLSAVPLLMCAMQACRQWRGALSLLLLMSRVNTTPSHSQEHSGC